MDQDQRRQPRISVNREFSSFSEFLEEYATNVSRGGAFIRTDAELKEDALTDLEFTVLNDGVKKIEGQGVVVRTQDDPKGVGVVFTSLTEASQDVLAHLFDREIVRELSEEVDEPMR